MLSNLRLAAADRKDFGSFALLDFLAAFDTMNHARNITEASAWFGSQLVSIIWRAVAIRW